MKYSPVSVIVVCLVFLSLCVCSLETFTNECPNGPIGLISTVATHEMLQYVSLKGLDFKHLEREGRLGVFVCDTEEQERILSLISKNQFDSSKTHFKKAQPGKLLFEKNTNPTSFLPDGYSDLDAIWEHLESAASQYPDLVSIVNTSIYGPGATYEGRLLPIVKVSVNVQEDEDEPNILILSAHHSREIVTPQLALSTLDELLTAFNQKSHPQHSKIVSLLNSSEIFIAPIWNPDGYDYVWNSNNMWRKNRKPSSGSAYGVDQNRNYHVGWNTSCSGSTSPSSEAYKGPEAESEEETQVIIEFSATRNFAKVIDFHSYGREVLLSFLCTDIEESLDDYIVNEGVALSKETGEGVSYSSRRPSADGEHHQHHIRHSTAYSYIVETQTDFQPTFAEALQEFKILWPLITTFLERSIPYQGHVISSTQEPLNAQISIQGIPQVAWTASGPHSTYHLFLPDGQYSVTFSAEGYQSVTKTIQISNSSPVANQDVILIRD